MLDAHPQTCVANDTHFIPRFLEASVSADLLDRLATYHRFHRLGLAEQTVREIGAQCVSYRDFISALYCEYARAHGKSYAGEKTPDYVKHLPLLHDLFPNAKFVHLIRDGRDVALSAQDWASKKTSGPAKFPMWLEEPVAVCALWWNWQVSQGRLEGQKLGKYLYCEVKYEDLINDPGTVLQAITQFLGLPFHSEMLRYYEGKEKSRPGISAKRAWLPPTAGLRNWKSQMKEREIQLFEILAGNLLDGLNYERLFFKFPEEIANLASQYNASWVLELKRRSEQRGVQSGAVS